MRFIVYGVGAVGGVVAGALVRAGQEVVGVARGARLDALRLRGMTLRSPLGTEHLSFPCAGSAVEIGLRDDDVVLLVVKGQDSAAALTDLRAAGMQDQPLFCVQNGVENERTALRLFPNVHGVNVMLPAQYMEPHETIALCSPKFGIFDIGRYPTGSDAADTALAEALTPGGILGYVTDAVMENKYGKLFVNLGNIVEAALGREVDAADLKEILMAEGREVLDRAGIAWRDVGKSDPRREAMRPGTVEGVARIGGSTSQSLARGAGSVETDYLNGEIVLLGRLHGIATPANAYAMRLAARLAREKRPTGSVSYEEMAAGLRG